MPSADRLLVACPECHAWPMAIGPRNELAPIGYMLFRCPRCGHQQRFNLTPMDQPAS
jgi:RNase P subunit RPR2